MATVVTGNWFFQGYIPRIQLLWSATISVSPADCLLIYHVVPMGRL